KVLIPGRPTRRKDVAAGGAAVSATAAAGGAAPSGAAPAADAPGVPPGGSGGPQAGSPCLTAGPANVPPGPAGGPKSFLVDVDGEVFNVKISQVTGGEGCAVVLEGAMEAGGPRDMPAGAVVAGAPGLVLSIAVGVGDLVAEGDEIAVMEIMKMRRSILSSRQGVVREIWAQEGEMLDADDILLVVG
ncbi:MAG: hypothetical protein M1274_03120, partial [Actinobacteria bacterium]|nr:hypothetical protein [Actinomycetota bacterium]